MVTLVNISEIELEQINQLFLEMESIVNEQRHWQIESIIEVTEESIKGVIQAFISMIIKNFENSLARFRIYPRYIKKMRTDEIRVHSTTRISPVESEDIAWVLTRPSGEFQKFAIGGMNTNAVAMYEEPKTRKTEIPKMDLKWISFMKAKQNIITVNSAYTYLKQELGEEKAKKLFDDEQIFLSELDDLFCFLEGIFKVVAYIAIMESNIEGRKGIILKEEQGYSVIFENYTELEALDKLVYPNKMSQKEYIDLRNYQWECRTTNMDIVVEVRVNEEKKQLIYSIKKRNYDEKKLISGERMRKTS